MKKKQSDMYYRPWIITNTFNFINSHIPIFRASACKERMKKKKKYDRIEHMVEGFFDEIPDSRQDWKVLHSIEQILTVVMCGVIAGENTIHGIYTFSQIKEKWLREKVELKLPMTRGMDG